MTEPRRVDPHQQFAGPRIGQIDLRQPQRFGLRKGSGRADPIQNGGGDPHGVSLA